ncbi:MAG: hypothetical protein ACREQ5_16400 [Candidatus Dormibacteria bacterium]
MTICAQSSVLNLGQGTTYNRVYRWSAPPLIYGTVTAVPSLIPLTLTVPAHGVVDGWPVAMTALGGFTPQLMASTWPPDPTDYTPAHVVDSNTIQFNTIDATRYLLAASTGWTSGGLIAYLTPVSLTGVTAVLNIYNLIGLPYTPNPVLSPPTPPPPPVPVLTVTPTVGANTITVTLTAAQTTSLAVGQYSYTLEVTDGLGNVTLLDSGQMLVFLPGTTAVPNV